MHAAWFNEGAPVPAGTTFPIVSSNSSTLDPESLNVIINPAVSLITISDLYGRPVPDFSTYTAPFTVNSVFPNANPETFIYIVARAFDTVTGAGQQCEVYVFQTRVQPQD